LRILLITARPEGAPFIDQRIIGRELLDVLESQIAAGTVDLEFLRPPTLTALAQRLYRDPPVHVLHFDGHGVFGVAQGALADGQGAEGRLLFEQDNGEREYVEGRYLAPVLRKRGIRLVVLTACQSATGTADNAFSSVASQLIQGGVDTVAAMSATVLVVSAAKYAEAFYRTLATSGATADIAHEQAQHALWNDARRHPFRRHPEDQGEPVELRDWWLPHLYLQRSLTLKPSGTQPMGSRAERAARSSRLGEAAPAEPRYGFHGRAVELLQIERHLLRGKMVVVHGFGGVGKTALVSEAADWLTRTRMYSRACFVSFEYGGDSTMLLYSLGNFLGINDSGYKPEDTKAALARLEAAVQHQHTLVLVDGIESILAGGNAPLPPAELAGLWESLLGLAAITGCGVILTTRNTSFGDARLASDGQAKHILLRGLPLESGC
jgi:hypothetical protein